MQKISRLKYFFLVNFSSPAGEHPLYRVVAQRRVRSILEIGMGDGHRAQRMIQIAMRHFPAAAIQYTGIDLFEARAADQHGLSLKEAHKLLRRTGVAYKLAPGDPRPTLARTANDLDATDLIVISDEYTAEEIEYIWYYIPRMLHANSVVMKAEKTNGGDSRFNELCQDVVNDLSAHASRIRQQVAA